MKPEVKKAIRTLLKAPIMLAACHNSIEGNKSLSLSKVKKIDKLIDDLEKAVPLIEEWLKNQDSDEEEQRLSSVVEKLSEYVHDLGHAIVPARAHGTCDATGGFVSSLAESLMGVTSGLVQISASIESLQRPFNYSSENIINIKLNSKQSSEILNFLKTYLDNK
jgi:hypothetical protein